MRALRDRRGFGGWVERFLRSDWEKMGKVRGGGRVGGRTGVKGLEVEGFGCGGC